MDAIKGIGSVAAQGINQATGSNIGGTAATGAAGVGGRQQAAMAQATQIAQKQAESYADWYTKTAGQATNRNTLGDDLQRILKELMPRIGNYFDLPKNVNAHDKATADQTVRNIDTAMRTLANPATAKNPDLAKTVWLKLTTAAAQANVLKQFAIKRPTAPTPEPAPGQAPAGTAPGQSAPPKDLGNGLSLVGNQIYYQGRPVDPEDRYAMSLVSQYLAKK